MDFDHLARKHCILAPNSLLIEPLETPCAYFNLNICRSCEWIDLPYAEQLTRKEDLVYARLQNFGKYQTLRTVSGSTLGFRNKAKMTITGTVTDPVIGILAPGKLNEGREILDCPVHHPRINQALHELKRFIRLAKIEPYQIETQKGELKGIIVFYSEHSAEMYVRFVLRSKEAISRIEKHAADLRQSLPELTSISANLQPIPHAILEGKEEIAIAGKGSVTHRLHRAEPLPDLELELTPRAFVQTNQGVAEHLYQTAAAWVQEIGTRKFTELFCGQGAFSFFVQDKIEEGLGIEINPEAVLAANATAKRENAAHLKFVAADAASVCELLDQFGPDTLLVNPPRKGLGHSLHYLQGKGFQNLIYSSCNLETLAQDLEQLPQYQIEKLQIFDLFPHTSHFEILVHLVHKSL